MGKGSLEGIVCLDTSEALWGSLCGQTDWVSMICVHKRFPHSCLSSATRKMEGDVASVVKCLEHSCQCFIVGEQNEMNPYLFLFCFVFFLLCVSFFLKPTPWSMSEKEQDVLKFMILFPMPFLLSWKALLNTTVTYVLFSFSLSI